MFFRHARSDPKSPRIRRNPASAAADARMTATLSIRLAMVLLGTFGAIGMSFYRIATSVNDTAMAEATQGLNRPLAAYIASFIRPERAEVANLEVLRRKFAEHMQVNPATEIYLLGSDGQVKLFHPTEFLVEQDHIDLAPIREYLQPNARLPILGDDPRSPGEPKIFSAAPLPVPFPPGSYLYIVLGGEQYRQQLDSQTDRYRGELALWAGLLGGVFALIAGLLLHATLTRRIERLASEMSMFDPVATTDLPRAEASGSGPAGDEISRLRATFTAMSARIASQVEQLQQADRNRRRFIASVSHDLRAPLTVVQGQLDWLGENLSQRDDPLLTAPVVAARAATRRLAALTADLFELAQLEAPDRPIVMEPLVLDELVADIVQEFQPTCAARGVAIEAELGAGIAPLNANPALLQRAIANLIDNALQHAKQLTRIDVRIETGPDSIGLTVSDDGAGIPEDQLPFIFDPFFRGNGQDGAGGLGLAIAARVASLHGGSIIVANRSARGAEFRLRLPATADGGNE